MKRPYIASLIALAVLFLQWQVENVCAQEQAAEKNFHVFTDKKGQTIEAIPLEISADKTNLRIQRKDGRQFDFPILTLSLDDQQYIKDWMKGTPTRKEFNLEVKATKHQDGTVRQEPIGYDYVKWATTKTNYNITIKNLSRDVLSDASIEYFIILSQGLYVNPYAEGSEARKQYGVDGWWYSHNGPSARKGKGKRMKNNPLYLIHGKSKVDPLPFNYEMVVETETFPLREIEGSRDYAAQDTVMGVIARITDKDGNELMVYRSSENKVVSQEWDRIVQMPKGDPLGNHSMDNGTRPRN